MRFRSAGNDAQAALFGENTRQDSGVGHHLLLIVAEFRGGRLFESHRLGGDDMHERSALQTGENGRVDGFLVFGLHQNDAAAWATQSFMRRRGNDIGVWYRIRVTTGGNQTRVMRHIDPKNSTNFLGHLGKTLKVDAQRVGRGPGNDDLRLVFAGQRFHLVVINGLVFVQTVGDNIEPLARHIERHTVRQMATFGQTHAHDRIARLGEGQQHRLISLRTGVWLHVGRIRAEQFFQAVDGQLFGNIDVLAAAVVALAWVAFGVLVGQLRTLGRHDGMADIIFGGDQLNVIFLTTILVLYRLPEFGVNLRQSVVCRKHRMPHKPWKKAQIVTWAHVAASDETANTDGRNKYP